jgi:hypothetical protein
MRSSIGMSKSAVPLAFVMETLPRIDRITGPEGRGKVDEVATPTKPPAAATAPHASSDLRSFPMLLSSENKRRSDTSFQ